MEPRHRVFISYRREDSAGHAGRLADHLLDRFGAGSVFMDVESIVAGADFTEAIERAIAGADAVLVLIGPTWLGTTTASGTRRLDEPGDFVRREIEAALGSDLGVIPVLVGGASMPAEADLPSSIVPLAHRNAVELQDRRWREDVDALVDVLEGRDKAPVGNLPALPTPFLGRARELAEIVELVRGDDVRLLTLTGPGGIGKTRLAIQAAAGLMPNYPGGAWFVGLAPLTDPDLVLAELASVLGVREAIEESLVRAIAERVSRAHTLIVLDNLEQLLPMAAIPIAELSAAASSLHLIVSSREPLHLAAEREYPVPTLSQVEAIDLFVARARAVRPAFDPDADSQRDAIDQICTRLDRLPLAIELAAARVKLLPPVKLLKRLEQRLSLLTSGPRDAPERQRTLRATIAWSHDLLSEDERQLFERLAIFSGGCTLEAAESVCDADLDTLQSLVERNLVREQNRAKDGARYVMLETIREYALERFEERSDAEALHRDHAEFFLSIAEAADPELKGPDKPEWIDRLDAEHDNYRDVLQWALNGSDPERGLRLAWQLSFVWEARRPVSEIRRNLAEALELAPAAASGTRARVLATAGYFAGVQGEDATALLEDGVRCAREAEDIAAEAHAQTVLCLFLPADRADKRVDLGRDAVRLARESGDRWVLSYALNGLGEAYRIAGDPGAATAAYEESLVLEREMENGSGIAILLVNLAQMALARADLPRARMLSGEALKHTEAGGDLRGTSFANAALGWAALAKRDLSEAAKRFDRALFFSRDLGYEHDLIDIMYGMSGVAAADGDAIRAARLQAVAASVEEVMGHQPSAGDAGIHLICLNELRAVTDPAIWEAAGREGASMSLEQAIEYALSD